MRIFFPGVWWNDLNKADENDFFVFVENHEGRQVCYVGNEALENVEDHIKYLHWFTNAQTRSFYWIEVSNQHNEINLVQSNFQLSLDIQQKKTLGPGVA